MRQGILWQSALMALLTALLLLYFGVQAYRYFTDPFSTTLAYPYGVEVNVDLQGYVVRDEVVLDQEAAGFLRTERAEGERVSAGGVVALVYDGQEALDRQTELDNLSDWLNQLKFARESALSAELSVRLDVQIFQNLLDYRRCITSGRLAQAEDQGNQLRALVLRRDYIPSSLEGLDAEIARTEEQLDALRAREEPEVRQVTAPAAGLYAGGSDGYESVLTPEFLKGLTPSCLSGLKPEGGAGQALGRIARGDDWYFAAILPAADAAKLEPYRAGRQLYLRFSRSSLRDFPVTLSSLSQAEGGRVAAVFRSRKYLSEVTNLRRQNAQAILGAIEGLRVPKEALRMVTEDDGSLSTGLYCVVGAEARFKPVDVVFTGENFLLVSASPSAARDSLILRPGDEVIVQANNLYDGKVISQNG